MFKRKFLERTSSKTYLTLSEAQKNAKKIDWNNFEIKKPRKLGIYTIENQTIEELLNFIDWSPFFRSWDLHGKYPDILNDKLVGEQAKLCKLKAKAEAEAEAEREAGIKAKNKTEAEGEAKAKLKRSYRYRSS